MSNKQQKKLTLVSWHAYGKFHSAFVYAAKDDKGNTVISYTAQADLLKGFGLTGVCVNRY